MDRPPPLDHVQDEVGADGGQQMFDRVAADDLALGIDLFIQVFRELTKPTIATGSAHEGNLKGGQGPWAREMAETRALSRAISAFTGLALPTPEEDER